MRKESYIVGIDEAGRGPLAGPVSMAAVLFKKSDERMLKKLFSPIRGKDSKKLSVKARDLWFGVIQKEKREGRLMYEHAFVAAAVIDSKGIVPSVRVGIDRVMRRLGRSSEETEVLLDGSLKAPEAYKNQRTIIRGDEKELSIQLASIVAKVLRDRRMGVLSRRYPAYGFDVHKGYGTKKHREKIEIHGLCDLHRRTFCGFLDS